MIIEIAELDDPRLDVYARLTDTQLRSKLEPEKAIFIAESDKVIRRALDGGAQPLSLLMEEKRVDDMRSTIGDIAQKFPEVPVFVAPRDEMKKLTGFELTRGALGAFRRPALPSVETVVRGARRIAVLENITNHTNVGAIFRSAAALGVGAVLVTPECYDPFYRRAVRVSMGTVFQIPWTRIGLQEDGSENPRRARRQDSRENGGKGGWAREGISFLHSLGFKTAAFALSPHSCSLDDPRLAAEERLALVFGTEGDGLAPETLARCDYTVRIPMAYDVDSLNVAAASAVAFWALCAKREP